MTVVAVVVAVIAATFATVTAVTAVIAVIAVISATAGMFDFVVPVGRVRYERAYSTACAGAMQKMSIRPRQISTLKCLHPVGAL